MSIHTFFKSLTSTPIRRRPIRRSLSARRLWLEPLEDRTQPSSFSAATAADLIADINAANQQGGSNTITLVAPSTSLFVLTAVDDTNDGATGLPLIAAQNNLTIIGNGDTIERSTAAGTPAFRLLDVASGAALTLENLTLQGGLAYGAGASASASGGAIYSQGSLTLDGATVRRNAAVGGGGGDGGGGYTDDANWYTYGGDGGDGGFGRGGAVYVADGTVSMTSDILSVDTAQGGRGGDGGGGYPVDVYYPPYGGQG